MSFFGDILANIRFAEQIESKKSPCTEVFALGMFPKLGHLSLHVSRCGGRGENKTALVVIGLQSN
jgi:hypothetical protein